MDREPTLEQHAREMLGLPPDWRVFRWQVVGKPGPDAYGVTLTGAVVRDTYQRGPRKGTPHWGKRLRDTECAVTIPTALHKTWLAQWERDTGKCHVCKGTGQEWVGWSKEKGDKYRTCSRCDGAGTPKQEAA